MSGYASFNIPDSNGRLVNGLFCINEEPDGALCGTVLDMEDKPIPDVTAILFEYREGESCPVAYAFTDNEGRFIFGPLKKGAKYTVRLWSGRNILSDNREAERDTEELYEKYKGLYEDKP